MDSLIGYTGFVGSNLMLQHKFDRRYNSKDVQEAFGTRPDTLVYAGVRAEMFLANSDPEADMQVIKEAIQNIKQIAPRKLILISTIAVYDDPIKVNEHIQPETDKLSAYGKNRLYLEEWVKKNFEEYLIVRLPAIYGENLKKNFIFDIIQKTPALLKEEKFKELCAKDDFISKYYVQQDNGFYKCVDAKKCKPYFEHIGFSALNFTDSRSVYQFYNLKYLWKHINEAMEQNIRVLNIATEPISASELYFFLYGTNFINEVSQKPFDYDMRTLYRETGYIYNKEFVLNDIKQFIEEQTK